MTVFTDPGGGPGGRGDSALEAGDAGKEGGREGEGRGVGAAGQVGGGEEAAGDPRLEAATHCTEGRGR